MFNPIKALVGLFTPMPLSGLLYLREALKRQGINPDALPVAALRDRVQTAVLVAELTAKGRLAQRAQLVDYLEGDANAIAMALTGDEGRFPSVGTHEWMAKHEIVASPRHLL